MHSSTPVPWSETLATPVGFGIAVYLLIGLIVIGFITFRGLKLRQPPHDGLLWEKKDNARNGLFLFQSTVFFSPIAIIIELFLWPLLLLFLWAYQDDDDEEGAENI